MNSLSSVVEKYKAIIAMAEEEKVSVKVSNSIESESLKSNETSGSSFYQWDEYREPIEINCTGRYILSDTENGKSIIFYDRKFFEQDKASELMDHILNTTNWQMKNVTIRGIEYPQPRLVAWYGPFPYSYSGMTLEAAEMPYYIFEMKKKIEKYLRKNGVNAKLNSVLLNRYRNNKDSVAWHSDDETSMGICPTIASVSLGDTRRFEMRRKLKYFEGESSYTETDDYFILLNNGSLLIMDGSMQEDWQHRVPKEHQPKHERINLTFRMVFKMENLLRSPKVPIKRGVTKIHRKKIFGKTVDTDAKSECSVTEDNKPEESPKSQLKVDNQICKDSETKRSLGHITKTPRENISFGKTVDADAESVCSVTESNKPEEEENPKSSFKLDDQICEDAETKRSLRQVSTKTHREKISFGKTVDTDAESVCSVSESNKPEDNNPKSFKLDDQICGDDDAESVCCSVSESNKPEAKNPKSSFKVDDQICVDAESKRSLWQVTKTHREKISFGKTVDADAESECSVTESNKSEKKNPKSSFKLDNQICGDAETKRSFRQVTKAHREKMTVDHDAETESFDTVCKTEDFKTITESKKPEEKNLKSSFKVEDKTWEDTETNAYKYFTLKTEEKLNESDEEEDIADLPFRKRKSKLDVKNGVKNIDNTDATTGKNKRFCISTQSITTHSLNNTVQNDFKIKNENTCNADNSCENDKFDSYELKDLLNYNVDLMNCKLFRNYANVLKNRILQNIDKFSLPAKTELEVLCELTDGNQTEEHQKIITRRICFVVDRALKLPEGNSKTC